MEPIEPASYMSLPQLCSQLGISPDLASNPVMVQVARQLFGPCAEITDGQRTIARGWDATRVEAVRQALDAHPVTQWRDLDCLSITAAAERANLAREELGSLMYQGLAPQPDVTITNHTGRRGPTHTRGWLPETIDTWAAARTRAELD